MFILILPSITIPIFRMYFHGCNESGVQYFYPAYDKNIGVYVSLAPYRDNFDLQGPVVQN